jgi:hypothetical protein
MMVRVNLAAAHDLEFAHQLKMPADCLFSHLLNTCGRATTLMRFDRDSGALGVEPVHRIEIVLHAIETAMCRRGHAHVFEAVASWG